MNYLAHIYLSGDSHNLMIGNFIGEFIKRKDPEFYIEELRDGISLHHAIDEFAHNHPVYKRSQSRINSKFFKYSEKIIDVFYDHFLASLWSNYSNSSLEQFAADSYKILGSNKSILPYKARLILPSLTRSNWLYTISSVAGIHKVCFELDKRSSSKTFILGALEDLIDNYNEFKEDFKEFFPDLIEFVNNEIITKSYNTSLVGKEELELVKTF
ncbi:MAG TPA: ACP phosphodiesterase [Cytophagaceae bacterium]